MTPDSNQHTPGALSGGPEFGPTGAHCTGGISEWSPDWAALGPDLPLQVTTASPDQQQWGQPCLIALGMPETISEKSREQHRPLSLLRRPVCVPWATAGLPTSSRRSGLKREMVSFWQGQRSGLSLTLTVPYPQVAERQSAFFSPVAFESNWKLIHTPPASSWGPPFPH